MLSHIGRDRTSRINKCNTTHCSARLRAASGTVHEAARAYTAYDSRSSMLRCSVERAILRSASKRPAPSHTNQQTSHSPPWKERVDPDCRKSSWLSVYFPRGAISCMQHGRPFQISTAGVCTNYLYPFARSVQPSPYSQVPN